MEVLSKEKTAELRKKYIGSACSLFFPEDPLKIVRASRQYMYTDDGTRYLDCINNVSHVGHSHPRVVDVCADQMAILNTNARFLHDNLVLLAQRLAETLPSGLSVLYLCNSGSEANDLALRMARLHTKGTDVITMDHAYHGHVASCMEISPYKHRDRTEMKQYPHVHVTSCPDVYRGKYRDSDYTTEDITSLYVNDVKDIIEAVKAKGKQLSSFIAESMQSCGGQIVYPKNYLKEVYRQVHAAGGVCIADEVQVGFGRVGSHFWAFQTQDVVPDIVTMGKPMGNGHPLSAVATTPEIAASHAAKGICYFNTVKMAFPVVLTNVPLQTKRRQLVEIYTVGMPASIAEPVIPECGGNPVSCAIGLEVLNIIRDEKLMEKATNVGNDLKKGLLKLKEEFPQKVGDVRGIGLFLGIDFVKDPLTREPDSETASYIHKRMKRQHILVSIDGPHNNVIKFKPPMCFTSENADHVVTEMRSALKDRELSREVDSDESDSISLESDQRLGSPSADLSNNATCKEINMIDTRVICPKLQIDILCKTKHLENAQVEEIDDHQPPSKKCKL